MAIHINPKLPNEVKKIIIGLVAAAAIFTIGYLAYQRFIASPKQDEAANEMFLAQQNFQKATDGVASDSLYKLSLNGSEPKAVDSG